MSNPFPDITKVVKDNPKTSLAVVGFAALGALAFMGYRRYSSSKTDTKTLQPTSGHWTGTDPVLPGPSTSHLPTETRRPVEDYLTETHMNLQHGSFETFQRRATAHEHWKSTENAILDQTASDLRRPSSANFQFSSHMVHSERRLLHDRAQEMRAKKSESADQELQKEVTRMTTTRAQGMGKDYDTLTDMIIHGKQGPLTKEQSALGVEATIVGHHVMRKTDLYGVDNPRMEATRPTDPRTGKTSHATTSPFGIDLSQDPGTAERDKLGLPVMMGTSGSASDVTRSHRYTMEALSKADPSIPSSDLSENRQPMKELVFHWMRRGAPMAGVRDLISKNQEAHGQKKISTPLPTATQTHTYPEIAAGVDLTLDGNSTHNLQRSTEQAKVFMASKRPK